MTDDLIDIKTVAQVLQRAEKTVRDRLVHAPGFPAPRIVSGPRSRLWSKADVLAWATPGARRSPAQTP
jgi:predicted DNA-binding transcriptional regulator AlpA